jgi:hypothetical protein
MLTQITFKSDTELNFEQLTSRTLAILEVDETCGSGKLDEYILMKLPSHQMFIKGILHDIYYPDIELENRLDFSWLKRYLLKHHATLERCDIEMNIMETGHIETSDISDMVTDLGLGYCVKRGPFGDSYYDESYIIYKEYLDFVSDFYDYDEDEDGRCLGWI